jgi:Ca2+-binding EF-hand superfamily protein
MSSVSGINNESVSNTARIDNIGANVDSSFIDTNLSDGATFNYQVSHQYGDITIDQSNFSSFDTDSDGEITRDEFKSSPGVNKGATKAWDTESNKDLHHDVGRGFNKTNTDGHSAEGVKGVSKSMDQNKISGSVSITLDNFNVFDENNDNQITRAELARRLRVLDLPTDGINDIANKENGIFRQVTNGTNILNRSDLIAHTNTTSQT